jgi:hypothetical protein
VTFQGTMLCGPCKNYRIRQKQRPPQVSVMAIFAPLIALIAGGIWLFVMLAAAGAHAGRNTALSLGGLGLLPQVFAMTLALLSLHAIETERNRSGREWAFTGLIAALVSGLMIALLTMMVLHASEG